MDVAAGAAGEVLEAGDVAAWQPASVAAAAIATAVTANLASRVIRMYPGYSLVPDAAT